MRLPETLQSNVISYGEDRNQGQHNKREGVEDEINVRKGVPLAQTI